MLVSIPFLVSFQSMESRNLVAIGQEIGAAGYGCHSIWRGELSHHWSRRIDVMFVFMRNLMMCTMVGIVLAVVFLTTTGAVVGAVNGFLVGICVGLGEWKATRAVASPIQQLV
jgi:hypothetical protein